MRVGEWEGIGRLGEEGEEMREWDVRGPRGNRGGRGREWGCEEERIHGRGSGMALHTSSSWERGIGMGVHGIEKG